MSLEEILENGKFIEALKQSEVIDILDEAKKAVNERKNIYGVSEDSFSIIAEFWSTYLNKKITSSDVAMMMILLKVARQKNQHKLDNLIDIAGYAECAGRIYRGGE